MAQPVHAQPVYAQPVYHYHVSQAPAAKPGPPANPGPLGLFGFGMTTTTLCFVISEWAKGPFADTVVGYALAYGGATQWVAGLLEMFNGNTFGGTAFMSYGAFWIAWWYSGFVLQAPLETTGAGLVHALWGLLTLGFFVITVTKRLPVKVQVVFGSLAATFFLLSGGTYNKSVNIAAGYVGMFCGMSANWAAMSDLFEAVPDARVAAAKAPDATAGPQALQLSSSDVALPMMDHDHHPDHPHHDSHHERRPLHLKDERSLQARGGPATSIDYGSGGRPN